MRFTTSSGAAAKAVIAATKLPGEQATFFVFRAAKDVEFSWPIGMPLVRSLGRDLWEVRGSLTGGKIARVIFCVEEGRMVLLHGFIKKSRKTPQKDIDLARKRYKGQE